MSVCCAEARQSPEGKKYLKPHEGGFVAREATNPEC